MRLLLVAALALGAGVLAAQVRSEVPKVSWKPLEFLIGSWEAKTRGGTAGADSSGTYTFRLELREHVLSRHSSAAGCKGPVDFDCEHSDLLYVYPEAGGQSYRAVYFDNEGHVIHYDVSMPSPLTAVFLSKTSEPGPQFRLTYERQGSTMSGRFEIRMPGQAEFRPYLEWSGEKK